MTTPGRAERRRQEREAARAAQQGPSLEQDERLVAYVELVRRCGARQVQVRFSDDVQPVVWMGVATFVLDDAGHPTRGEGHDGFECSAGPDPWRAMARLCERLIDGNVCTHCKRPAGFHDGFDSPTGYAPLDAALCWYMWDPELRTFRRSCEGDQP